MEAQEPDAALPWFRAALAIREKLSPGSEEEAESLYAAGRCLREKGDLAAAASSFERAFDSLDLARGRLGGSEDARSGWAARHTEMYHSAIETALDRGRNDEGFHILERARARATLAMLAARDLRLEGEFRRRWPGSSRTPIWNMTEPRHGWRGSFQAGGRSLRATVREASRARASAPRRSARRSGPSLPDSRTFRLRALSLEGKQRPSWIPGRCCCRTASEPKRRFSSRWRRGEAARRPVFAYIACPSAVTSFKKKPSSSEASFCPDGTAQNLPRR